MRRADLKARVLPCRKSETYATQFMLSPILSTTYSGVFKNYLTCGLGGNQGLFSNCFCGFPGKNNLEYKEKFLRIRIDNDSYSAVPARFSRSGI